MQNRFVVSAAVPLLFAVVSVANAQVRPAMGMIVADATGAVLGQVVDCQEGTTETHQRCVVGVELDGQVYPIAVNARDMVGGSTNDQWPNPYVKGAIYFTEQGCGEETGPYLAARPAGFPEWIWDELPVYAVIDTTLYVADPTATPTNRIVRAKRQSADNDCIEIPDTQVTSIRPLAYSLPGADRSFRLIPSNVIFIDGFPNPPLDEWSGVAP